MLKTLTYTAIFLIENIVGTLNSLTVQLPQSHIRAPAPIQETRRLTVVMAWRIGFLHIRIASPAGVVYIVAVEVAWLYEFMLRWFAHE